MTLSVLFVCTGNLCRSPMAERLFRVRVAGTASVATASAGTAAAVGLPMDEPSALALRERGGDPDGHVARQLQRSMVVDADLILTAGALHRSLIVQADPASFRKTFTLREFGRLGAGATAINHTMTAAAMIGRIAEVAGQRGVVEPAPSGADEIADPFGAPLKVARRCAGEVSDAVDAVLGLLGLQGAPTLGADAG